MKLGMKDDLSTLSHCPTNCFRIAPALVTDDDPEFHSLRRKYLSSSSGRIEIVFRRIKLDLILKPGHRSLRVNDQGSSQQLIVDDSFRAEYHCHLSLGG